MTKREKLRAKIAQNPKHVSLGDLERLLKYYGFHLVDVRGSHHTYKHEWGAELGIGCVVIPFRRPHVREFYVKKVLNIIESLEASDVLSDQEEDDDREES